MAISVKQKAKVAAWVLVAVAVAAAPIGVSAADQSSTTTITTDVQPVISISSGANVGLNITPDATGVISSGTNTVTVSTNVTNGYTLAIKDSDATTTLASAGGSFAANASPTTADALANGEWGWAVPSATVGVGVTGFDASYASPTLASTFAGVNASGGANVNVKTRSGTATNDTTTVYFAARANTSQPSGQYTGAVTYTATTN